MALTLSICKNCPPPKVGDVVTTTTADFDYCCVCGAYTTTKVVVNAIARLLHSDPCDCGSTIMHNDGGNYHYSYWKILKIVSIDDFH